MLPAQMVLFYPRRTKWGGWELHLRVYALPSPTHGRIETEHSMAVVFCWLGWDILKVENTENNTCMFQSFAHNHQQISLAASLFSVGVCSIQLIPSSWVAIWSKPRAALCKRCCKCTTSRAAHRGAARNHELLLLIHTWGLIHKMYSVKGNCL